MPKTIVPDEFLKGRAAYVAEHPLLEVAHMADQFSDPASFLLGYFDGALADIRMIAKASHQMGQRA